MNRLIAAGSEQRRSQNFLRPRIHQNLHEPLRFALFYGSRNFGHGTLADERAAAALAHLRLRHSGASKRRVDIQPISKDAIAHPAWIIIQKVRGDNFEIVVGGVRECALAIAIAQRPDARNAAAKLIVHFDDNFHVAGGLLAAQSNSGQLQLGTGFGAGAVVAVVVGGVAITGGVGTPIGSAIGAIFVALLVNVASLAGLDYSLQRVVEGALVFAVVVLTVSPFGRPCIR